MHGPKNTKFCGTTLRLLHTGLLQHQQSLNKMINAEMTHQYRMFGQTRPLRYMIILCAFRKDPSYLVFDSYNIIML